MVDDQTPDKPNPSDPKRTERLASHGCGIFLYLVVAYFAIGLIAGSIHDYDRHFPNPRFHMSPTRVAWHCGIGGVVMLFVVPRTIYLVRRVWKMLRADREG